MLLVILLKDYIYISTFDKFININYILFSYNLLFIYPLDGGKLLNIFLNQFTSYKNSLYITIIISLILSIFLIIYFIIKRDLFLTILFIFTFYNSFKEYKKIDFNNKIYMIKYNYIENKY